MLTDKETQQNFLKLLALFVAIVIPWIAGGIYYFNTVPYYVENQATIVEHKTNTISHADHSLFELLQQPFETPQQVTGACLSCHNNTDQEIMSSSHWKWERDYVTDSGDTIQLGKKNIINNFCIGISSNEPRCTSCHIGYGWKDNSFDFNDNKNIDCLVCHDQTGTYKKFPTGAGLPVAQKKEFKGKIFDKPDYNLIAQNVGAPKRENCGVCHFVGGGGNNVKHGDLANEINQVTRDVDVHMGINGVNMSCVDCHKTDRHNISGSLYSVASTNENRVRCEQCHSDHPHSNTILNRHTKKVACQTCHIPRFAKISATKMNWDWSTAGKFNADSSKMVLKDSLGNMTYATIKGSFVWERNVVPEYHWFNGNARHHLLEDKIDTSNVIQLNTLLGSYSDKNSKIVPVKKHAGRQIYDAVNNTLIVPRLFGKDSTAYWKGFDWDKAAQAGMESVDLPYSGEYGFVSTEMYWPINHMVSPKEESLQCADCHSRDSYLKNLNDFYLPGRDHNNFFDNLGIILLIISFLGVLTHGLIRLIKN